MRFHEFAVYAEKLPGYIYATLSRPPETFLLGGSYGHLRATGGTFSEL
jgi:hypothetical protein